MALLSAAEAKHNLKVFQSTFKSTLTTQIASSATKSLQMLQSDRNGNSNEETVVAGGGGKVLGSLPQPPESNIDYFKDPKHHLDVLSTLLATTMAIEDYTPGSQDIGKFINFMLGVTKYFPQYVSLSMSKQASLPPGDYLKPMAKMADFFKTGQKGSQESADTLVDMVKGFTQSVTLFCVLYMFEGAGEANPSVTMYYSNPPMYTCLESSIYCITFQLMSTSVSADAELLVGAVVKPIGDLLEIINK